MPRGNFRDSQPPARHLLANGKDLLLQGGVTASAGVASGRVFLVKKTVDSLRFPEGAVLVSSQALPSWAALLYRAAAVVTEHGSVTSHLANVAREFEVPALFAVAGATSALTNGELVTVDADGRKIYSGRIESLLRKRNNRKDFMRGSPVYRVLEQVVPHIVSFNLLDPDAPTFKPSNCRTFHDITRFAHEKSVQEIFNFGRTHHFSERSSKQLLCDVPMQWWVINLDDGFRKEVEGKFVELDNIVSIPMRAIWEGVTAFPWSGPPPVDAKGFMSVLMQATSNPSMDPARSSLYANRNYWYCQQFCVKFFSCHFSEEWQVLGNFFYGL
ncbi:MAG: hypothetical protein JRI89_09835 [Deltaproteobacteria bacterium]|nr:hypothetical protein [Deltaproteobacteria bacterium]